MLWLKDVEKPVIDLEIADLERQLRTTCVEQQVDSSPLLMGKLIPLVIIIRFLSFVYRFGTKMRPFLLTTSLKRCSVQDFYQLTIPCAAYSVVHLVVYFVGHCQDHTILFRASYKCERLNKLTTLFGHPVCGKVQKRRYLVQHCLH